MTLCDSLCFLLLHPYLVPQHKSGLENHCSVSSGLLPIKAQGCVPPILYFSSLLTPMSSPIFLSNWLIHLTQIVSLESSWDKITVLFSIYKSEDFHKLQKIIHSGLFQENKGSLRKSCYCSSDRQDLVLHRFYNKDRGSSVGNGVVVWMSCQSNGCGPER